MEDVAKINQALQSITDKAVTLIQYQVESETVRRSLESSNGNGKEAVVVQKSKVSDTAHTWK